ncbi:MAG TPA: M14 family metallopeptidase [Oscillatoriaceae cyanobacterium]
MSLKSRLLGTLAIALTLTGCGQASRPDYAAAGGTERALSTATQLAPVVLQYGDRNRLTRLVEAGADVWSVDVYGRRAQARLNDKQMALAKSLGMQIQPLQGFTAMRVGAGYRTYEQLLAQLQQMAAQHPDYVQLVDLGPTWETVQHKADRHVWALRVSKGSGARPVVTFAGCTHAREIVTPEVVMDEAQYLVDGYGKDPQVTNWVNTREIWLVPMVNPDGHHLVMARGEDQRKNTNDVTGGKDRVGVDLNRNYDAVWGTVGDSDDPESDVFRGTAPFSEPETQDMRNFLTAHKPTIYISFHSYSNSVMWPYDSTTQVPADKRLAILGKALGKLSGYKPYQGCEMYLNSGDDVEWLYRKFGVLSYTVEIGSWNDGFMPPFGRMPAFFKQNQAMMNYCLQVADNPAGAR